MKKYLKKNPTGGEESPADGLYTLTHAVEVAGSTDRQKVVSAIETMGDIKFASIAVQLLGHHHLSKKMDDLIMVTLERSSGPVATSPAYELGKEWTRRAQGLRRADPPRSPDARSEQARAPRT